MKITLLDDEGTPYKRKKESNTSKSTRKSKHKHDYRQCLLKTTNEFNGRQIETLHLGRICNICGKTHIDKYFITRKTEHGTYLMLENNEILATYTDLEIIPIED